MDLNELIRIATTRIGQHACFVESNRLMFITHRTEKYTELDEIKMVIEGGCDWVQLRMKGNHDLDTTKKIAQEVAKLEKLDFRLCLNDDVEMAIKANIFAVHLGKEDMPVSDAWKLIAKKGLDDLFLVGATANTFEDILKAAAQGASYIGLGPYRFTETKKKLSPILGLEGYRKIMNQCKEAGVKIPIFAIGGIQLEDVDALMDTGIAGIAVSGAIINAPDPVEETKRFIKEIFKNRPELQDPYHPHSGVE